jgi:hypothetical protein
VTSHAATAQLQQQRIARLRHRQRAVTKTNRTNHLWEWRAKGAQQEQRGALFATLPGSRAAVSVQCTMFAHVPTNSLPIFLQHMRNLLQANQASVLRVQ